ncbi:discoidin domain-containing protein [Paenibacillus sp. 1781tsa1]|uniref:discoidin domain-containing protein n=1 Tax=Paenibacillus sp. 1781tsa1 TaxID=2953810 RepID=UPI00209EE157|nr:discoidin domain-containing protein [Paenibacillus sp. 1781tsa1]MCP1185119.1 discoidin domain-containing protein [Paenibacillus sp. 1781tsa1]
MAIKVISQTNNLSVDLMKVFGDTITDTYLTDSYNIWVEIDVLFEKTIYALESVDVYVDNGANANQPYGFEVWANGQKIAERLGLGTGGSSWSKLVTTNVKVIDGKKNINTNSVKLRILGTSSSTYRLIIPHITFNNAYSNKFLISSEDKYYSVIIPSTFENPAMTSNTTPIGVSSASSVLAGGEAWRAFDKNSTSGWITANGSTTGWIKYDFGSDNEKIINYYSLSTYLSTSRSPKSWTFEGSNTGVFSGEQTILDSKTNISSWIASETKEYSLINTQKFRYYRLNVTANNGDTSYLNVYEFKMKETTKGSLLNIANTLESNFLNHGMNKSLSIDLSSIFESSAFIEQNATTLGSGKVFKQKIDTSKTPIKKASIT